MGRFHIFRNLGINVLGVKVASISMPEAVTVVQKWVERGERHYVYYATGHGVMKCQRDKSLAHIYHDGGLNLLASSSGQGTEKIMEKVFNQ
jgi:UDP-N-acetyl-D-mannosaminuronic acid transferase (WecB/TagA/CpsF family)